MWGDHALIGRKTEFDGTVTGAGNLISGNTEAGVKFDQLASSNMVTGNMIGTDRSGMLPVANGVGVLVVGGASNNWIGYGGVTIAAAAGDRNVISGNTHGGVDIDGASRNSVSHNLIGTAVTGDVGLPNGDFGVRLTDSASINVIGEPGPYGGNLISGNDGDGILITNQAAHNYVYGNLIGTDVHGVMPLPGQLQGPGIELSNSASDNIVGTFWVSGVPGMQGAATSSPGAGTPASTRPTTS